MSAQELVSEVSRLPEANAEAASLRGVVASLHGELASACTQGKHNMSALQTRAEVDRDMLYAVVSDSPRVQLLLDVERQKRQSLSVSPRICEGLLVFI